MNKGAVIGIGNRASGDDGIGPYLIDLLKTRCENNPRYKQVEFIAAESDPFQVLEHHSGRKWVLVVDSVRSGGKAGDWMVFSPEQYRVLGREYGLHGFNTAQLLMLAQKLHPSLKIKIMGIEPQSIKPGGISSILAEHTPEYLACILKEIDLLMEGQHMAAKVLIIDDDVDMVEAERMVLENNGYEVEAAYDGKEGYDKIKKEKPDVIILDVMMATVEEGFQLAYKLRNEPDLKNLPIVMVTSVGKVTGYKFDPKKDEDYLPVTEYLEKPVKPQTLLSAIEKALNKR
ncbi:MAG: hydrogenase maturation protease [Spirochaetota bacterium]